MRRVPGGLRGQSPGPFLHRAHPVKQVLREPRTLECLLSRQVDTTSEVDDLVGRVDAAGGPVVSGPEQKTWGYTGTFTDPDGHHREAIVSAI